VVVQRKGPGVVAAVLINLADTLPISISFDVSLRIDGQTNRCDKGLFRVLKQDGFRTSDPLGLTVELDSFGSNIKTADVILTPNPQAVERFTEADRIWGKEIMFTNVPLTRLDLGNKTSP
jgi:hypothetical protein